jgi:FkbM family methyltransferase
MSIIKWLARRVVPPRLLLRRWALIQLQSERELALVELVCEKSAAAVDVGANVGSYTYFAARYSSHVYALEPVPDVASMLRRGAPSNVTVFTIAASDKSGKCTIYVPKAIGKRVNTRASLEKDANPGFELEAFQIETRCLDECGLENVAFLKIDVEGHEHAVLRGAAGLISSCRPTILIESEERHRAGAVKATKDFLGEFGYRGFFLNNGYLRRIESFEPARHQRLENAKPIQDMFGAVYINNFLFIHQSRKSIADNVIRRFPQAADISAGLHTNPPTIIPTSTG